MSEQFIIEQLGERLGQLRAERADLLSERAELTSMCADLESKLRDAEDANEALRRQIAVMVEQDRASASSLPEKPAPELYDADEERLEYERQLIDHIKSGSWEAPPALPEKPREPHRCIAWPEGCPTPYMDKCGCPEKPSEPQGICPYCTTQIFNGQAFPPHALDCPERKGEV